MNRTHLHASMGLWASLCMSMVQAQQWCPPGAEWHYNYSDVGGTEGYELITFQEDTLINSIPAQKMTRTLFGWNIPFQSPVSVTYPPLYTAYTSDCVKLWLDNEFDTLWYFGAIPGATWQLPFPGTNDPYSILVTDTGSTLIDGVLLRWLAIEVPEVDGISVMNDTLIERIGSLNLPVLPWLYYQLDMNTGPLRCYADNEIGLSTNVSVPCDYTLSANQLTENRTPISIVMKTGLMTVAHIPSGSRSALQLFNVLGTCVLHAPLLGESADLDLSMLAAGPCICKIVDHTGRPLLTEKFVKL
ncbi:MAG: hypothetical protein M9900_12510 [Flavobacteriales bacterium]|nr:hypothetical protein [Flavobacteriales bacterium]